MKEGAVVVNEKDRKRSEKRIAQATRELQRSEFYLQQGERLANMGSWSLMPDLTFDYWSPEAIFENLKRK